MSRSKQTRASGSITEAPTEESFVQNKISLDELIDIVSLIDYPLNLLSSFSGRAKYRFEKFGEKKKIIYQDILSIIELYRSFMEKGYFLILDERVVMRHGLQDIQSKILSKSQLEKIIDGSKDAFEIYKNCLPEQQKLVIGMLTRKIANGHDPVDMNLVDSISRHSKVIILQNAEDAKSLFSKDGDEN